MISEYVACLFPTQWDKVGKMTTKRDYERAVKKSISLPQILLDDAELDRRQLRLPTFSDYIQFVIRCRARSQQENRPRDLAAA